MILRMKFWSPYDCAPLTSFWSVKGNQARVNVRRLGFWRAYGLFGFTQGFSSASVFEHMFWSCRHESYRSLTSFYRLKWFAKDLIVYIRASSRNPVSCSDFWLVHGFKFVSYRAVVPSLKMWRKTITAVIKVKWQLSIETVTLPPQKSAQNVFAVVSHIFALNSSVPYSTERYGSGKQIHKFCQIYKCENRWWESYFSNAVIQTWR